MQQTLTAHGLDARFAPGGDPAAWPAGRFRLVGGKLWLKLAADAQPPATARLRVCARNRADSSAESNRGEASSGPIWRTRFAVFSF